MKSRRWMLERNRLNIADAEPKVGSTKLAVAHGCLVVVSLFGLLLIAAQPMHAQAEGVVYNFPGYSNGQFPEAGLITDTKGNLYGTTAQGGVQGDGTVFEVLLPPSGVQEEKVRFSFSTSSDPVAGVILDTMGNLYGTTQYGGIVNRDCPLGCGVVFEITKAGKEKVLYKFKGGLDGANPAGGLVRDSLGNLYGTTANGALGCGTVFEITSGTENQLYAFTGVGDGCNPLAGLVADSSGDLFGTTANGGVGYGTVFEVTSGIEEILYIFEGGSDGAYPVAGLIMDSSGDLYGTTQQGGGANCGGNGCGTVFEVFEGGGELLLYSFTGAPDGANPYGSVVMDGNGNLYGTTFGGGSNNSGTVFEVAASGAETILHSFGGYPDGVYPAAGLVFDSDGHLYGTTTAGGVNDRGTVFYVVPK